jgi:hypothetical protein
MDTEQREQFDILLTTPPVVARGRALPQAAAEADGASFMAFMGATAG